MAFNTRGFGRKDHENFVTTWAGVERSLTALRLAVSTVSVLWAGLQDTDDMERLLRTPWLGNTYRRAIESTG